MFVLKLWCEPRETEVGSCLWRGSIENTMTRRVVYFNDLAELNTLLEAYLTTPGPDSGPRMIRPGRGAVQ